MQVWDYASDGYVHRLVQSKTDGKLVEVPSPAQAAYGERHSAACPECAPALAYHHQLHATNQSSNQSITFLGLGTQQRVQQTISYMQKLQQQPSLSKLMHMLVVVDAFVRLALPASSFSVSMSFNCTTSTACMSTGN